ncbi:hypothetical protein NEMIN01_1060 [Nematocida minor]|uniref:uncharacterized protein n=1 Tax=Nematocida minor TaxID=1912983 RepID=UPI00221EF042|nr:uncharacterized protein NEMIN01_1060 [Nematocida minor]KAI5190522.1 hypothetical protein NEMIN01_1060 [Nematocida minor]
MEESNKKSIFDILLLTVGLSVVSLIVLYTYIHSAIKPAKKNFGKVVLGKKAKKKAKRNTDVMSSKNSSVSIEISTAEMD